MTTPAQAREAEAREVLDLAGDIRWLELAEGSPFTVIDRQLLGEMHRKARSAVLLAFAAKQSQPVGEGDLSAVVAPWADYHGDLPDYDHPLRCVFESGVQYAVELLAKELGVDDWQVCDGTEEFDGDLGGTMMNIVCAALPADEHGEQMWPSEVRAALQSPASQPVEGIQHVADKIAAGIDRAHCEAGARGLPASQPVETDEYMSVSLSRDGVVTSHNAFDADFDEMVVATETIVRELQRRLSDRKFCPYSHGAELRKTAPASQPNREAVLREDTAFSISKRRHEEKRCVTNDRLREALERIAALNRREISSAGVAMRAIQIASAALTPAADLTGSGEK